MAIGATGSEDAWQRTAYISVESSSIIKVADFEALTETIDIDTGERDLDVINLLNLGQIPKHGGSGICTITFEGYPVEAGTEDQGANFSASGDAKGYFDVFASSATVGASQPMDIDMSATLTKYRVAILWTNANTMAGTADAHSDSDPSITDSGETWTSDIYNGRRVEVAAVGTYHITDNDGTKLTLTTGDKPESASCSGKAFIVYPTGSGAIASADKGMRFVLADCFCTSCKTSMTDGIVKQTLTFKGQMLSKTGVALCKMESDDGSAVIPWLGAYTAGTTYWA